MSCNARLASAGENVATGAVFGAGGGVWTGVGAGDGLGAEATGGTGADRGGTHVPVAGPAGCEARTSGTAL